MTEMTEAWATKTKGILVETVNMQKNEAAQDAKGTVLIHKVCAQNCIRPKMISIYDFIFFLKIGPDYLEL